MKITIMGLGYVGLPLTLVCSQKQHQVYGFDVDKDKIESLKKGVSPIKDEILEKEVKSSTKKVKFTNNAEEAINDSEIVIVCVPTPTDKEHKPDLSFVESASETISKNVKKGQLVIIESTIYPGTTEEVIIPILEKSGLKAGADFDVAYCPERIDPGNKEYTIKNLPRVVGAINKEGLDRAMKFYNSIIDKKDDVTGLSSIKAAEATKIMENTFRDINIAFVNEMAKSFDKAGIDISEVIRGASTKPFGFMKHYPGCGVGGHCIPVDPYYLIEKAKQIGFEHKFLSLAREINNSMPEYTVDLLEEELKRLGKKAEDSNVGVLGLAYKKDVDDLRESPALKIVEILENKKASVAVFDPYINEKSNVKDIDEFLEKSDYVILATDHSEFKGLHPDKLKSSGVKVIIDGRNCFDNGKVKEIKDAGIAYKGIGRS
jgi:UDP-N-acetyl-D-glucosamine dehydrogenase|tara:strand:- start:507 stop:1799 length:1293 start_codon:yes stop_codon:yes gene_type:complete